MRTTLALLGLAILLVSCATTKANYYPSTPDSLQGESVNTLINRWGKPNYKVALPDGHSLLSYTIERYSANSSSSSPGIGVTNNSGRPVITVTPASNNSWSRGRLAISCTYLFEINEKGVVVRTKTKGTNCYND